MTPVQPFSCLGTLDQFVQQSKTKPLLEKICRIAAAAFAAIPALLADLTIYTANKIYSISFTPPQKDAPHLQEKGSLEAAPTLRTIRALSFELQQDKPLYFDALTLYTFVPEAPIVEFPEIVEPQTMDSPLPSAPEMDDSLQVAEPLYPDLSEIGEPLQPEPSAPERIEEHPEIRFAKDILFLKDALERLPDDHELRIRISLANDPLDPLAAQEDFKIAAFVTLLCLHQAFGSHSVRIPDFLNLEMAVNGETLREFLISGKDPSTEKLFRFAEQLGQSDAFINALFGLRAEHALTVGT